MGKLERVKGIEPSYAAWEAAVLPLNYTRRPALYTAQAWQMQSPLYGAGQQLTHPALIRNKHACPCKVAPGPS
ncbi:hypothetical protein AA0616_0456 [Komagataeibacter nataicola NRIC 0616]|nr:hypothetical protein AA0616_0456 [Komagataeibacter nataicola NRIC 0616]